MVKDFESMRAELWANAAVGVATSSNSTKPEICIIWADKILSEFDKRFSEKTNEPR